MESSSPAHPKTLNVPIRSDSHESSGNIETAVSSGEDIHEASHSGGDTRISNLRDWFVFFANLSC